MSRTSALREDAHSEKADTRGKERVVGKKPCLA